MNAEKEVPATVGAVESIEEVSVDPVVDVSEAEIRAMFGGAAGKAALLEMIQNQLGGMIGRSSGYLESLPQQVQRRIGFLQDLQDEHDELHEQYKDEAAALEAKYQKLYAPLYEKRSAVVSGKLEAPAPAEGEVVEEGVEEEAQEGPVPAGIPAFWLNVLRNNPQIAESISEQDETILEYLADVTCEKLKDEEEEKAEEGAVVEHVHGEHCHHEQPLGFKLTFTFSPNPFFTNTVLTKTYLLHEENPPLLQRAVGTTIDWEAGKNPTVKTVVKKGKKGKKPETRKERVDSFFNFFSPPEVPDEDDEEAAQRFQGDALEALQEALHEDYGIGEIIKEDLIPNAVNWFTGDAIDSDDDEDEDDDEDDEEDDDDDDDDEEVVGQSKVAETEEQPAECKQQ